MSSLHERRHTRRIRVGNLIISGTSPIRVQSMTKTTTADIASTVHQIKALSEAGCDIIRVAVLTSDDARALGFIKGQVQIPLVADIHFNYRHALEAIKQGVDKIRLNPGNIKNQRHIQEIVSAARDKGIPIRVGVNSGSLPQEIKVRHEGVNFKGLVEAALCEISLLEKSNFRDIVVSLKSPDPRMMIEANLKLAKMVDYPIHLGVTEAGRGNEGIVYSTVGISSLLVQGIGDTIRVSLTDSPFEEVKVGRLILKSLGFLKEGVRVISCPTCGRMLLKNFQNIVDSIKEYVKDVKEPMLISIMGCVVNGPGEGEMADIGLVGYRGEVGIMYKGRLVKKVKEENALPALKDLIGAYMMEKKGS